MTPSSLALLATALSRWERAEYVCAGLLAVACIGEYAAHFTNWFTGGVEERKRRLAKRSTLLLAAALSFEFLCLVRTSTLAGTLIASLNNQVEEAGGKARKAVEDSAAAIAQSGEARAAARSALDESARAKVSASDALALARGARREADSFGRDVVSAKKETAEAELALATIRGDRVVSPSARTKLEEELARYKGMQFDLLVFRDSESISFMSSLRDILTSSKAGWVQIPSAEKFSLANSTPRIGLTLFSGVEIEIDSHRTEWKQLAGAIARILKEDGIAAEVVTGAASANAIHIIVGRKPMKQ